MKRLSENLALDPDGTFEDEEERNFIYRNKVT